MALGDWLQVVSGANTRVPWPGSTVTLSPDVHRSENGWFVERRSASVHCLLCVRGHPARRGSRVLRRDRVREGPVVRKELDDDTPGALDE
jgi:hypothetical protein